MSEKTTPVNHQQPLSFRGVRQEAGYRSRYKILVLDSRDRNFATYPNSSDVMFTPTEQIRNVKRISLASFGCYFPNYPGPLDTLTTIFLAICGLGSASSSEVRFPLGVQGLPGDATTLAVFNGCNTLTGTETDGLFFYQAPASNPNENSLLFPAGTNLSSLHMQLYWYNRPLGASVGTMELLPAAGYGWFPNQTPYSKESNWRAIIRIEFAD